MAGTIGFYLVNEPNAEMAALNRNHIPPQVAGAESQNHVVESGSILGRCKDFFPFPRVDWEG
jgi:hypothetical protein